MKNLTLQQAHAKIRRYCAYQERSHQEVRNKLYTLGLYRNDVDEIISNLVIESFLSEERFAKAFAGGKFRIKKWGRIKIAHALEAKGVSGNCIAIGLKEIDEPSYTSTLNELLKEKLQSLNGKDHIYILRDRVARYAIQKGYEPGLVWECLKGLI